MYAQLDQQVKNFDELDSSLSSVAECSKPVIQDVCKLPSKDQLKLLEEMKLQLESSAKLQKDVRVFRDSFATVKIKMLAQNSNITEDNVLSKIESYIDKYTGQSSIPPEQAEILKELDQHINSIKASPVPCVNRNEGMTAAVEEEEDITVTEFFGKIVDPLTKRNIENPVKNKVCGHVYEKTTMAEYLNCNKIRKCPYAGCANKELRLCDIVDVEGQ